MKSKSDKVEELRDATKRSIEDCVDALEENDWKLEAAYKSLKDTKKPKDKKMFRPGETIICIDSKPSKTLPEHALEFLLTYKYFTVKDVSDKLNIFIGHVSPDTGQNYYFSPNRFELREGTAPLQKAEEDDANTERKIARFTKYKEELEKEKEEKKRKSELWKARKMKSAEEKAEKEIQKAKEEEEKEINWSKRVKSEGDEDWDFELMK